LGDWRVRGLVEPDLGVSYVDTNIDEDQALGVGATKDIVDSAIVATLTASF
jgi:hypothetical protein